MKKPVKPEPQKSPQRSPKKVRKMCSYSPIDKLVMHNLVFLTPFLSSDDGSKNQETSESEDEEPQNVAYRWGNKRKPHIQQSTKYTKMSMNKKSTFTKHLYAYFTKIGDDVWDEFEMGALQLLKKYKDLQEEQKQ